MIFEKNGKESHSCQEIFRQVFKRKMHKIVIIKFTYITDVKEEQSYD